MGGSIRKDMSGRVTHLIANSSTGEKYRYATAFRVPVIERAWVERFWNDRHDVDLRAADETLLVCNANREDITRMQSCAIVYVFCTYCF